MMRAAARWLTFLCLLLALSACSSMSAMMFPQGVKLDWESISLQIDSAANRDFPIAVDLVLVNDEALASRLLGMPAQEWFASRDSLRKTYPGKVEFDSLELAPGDTMTLSGKRYTGKRVLAALAFADYLGSGDHRVRLDTLKGRINMEFGMTDFSASASEH